MSLALKKDALQSGYKQTELGLIPEDWEIKCLENAATLKARIGWQGLTTKEYLEAGDYFLVTGTEFKNGIIDWDNCFSVDAARYVQDRNIQLKLNDILVTKDGTIGKIAFISEMPKPATLNSGVFVIRPKNNEFIPKFFFHLLRSSAFDKFLSQLSAGSTINHLYQKDFVTFKYKLPKEKDEQKAIAEALGDADEYIAALEKLIAKKRNIKQGAMQDLLTGKKRLAGFEGEWKEHSIEEIADKNIQWSFTGGPFGSNLKSSDYVSEGVRVIQLQNIGDGIFLNEEFVFTSYAKANELLSCNIYPDDIILSKMGDPVARACIIPNLHNRYLMCSDGIRLAVDKKKFDNHFIFYSINFETFRKSADNAGTGSTRKRIGLSELRKLTINCPTLPEQQFIAKIIFDMDSEISTLETKLEKAKQIKQGMMQDLLSGKVRLI